MSKVWVTYVLKIEIPCQSKFDETNLLEFAKFLPLHSRCFRCCSLSSLWCRRGGLGQFLGGRALERLRGPSLVQSTQMTWRCCPNRAPLRCKLARPAKGLHQSCPSLDNPGMFESKHFDCNVRQAVHNSIVLSQSKMVQVKSMEGFKKYFFWKSQNDED